MSKEQFSKVIFKETFQTKYAGISILKRDPLEKQAAVYIGIFG